MAVPVSNFLARPGLASWGRSPVRSRPAGVGGMDRTWQAAGAPLILERLAVLEGLNAGLDGGAGDAHHTGQVAVTAAELGVPAHGGVANAGCGGASGGCGARFGGG